MNNFLIIYDQQNSFQCLNFTFNLFMYLAFFVRLVFLLLFYNTYFYKTRKKSISLCFFHIWNYLPDFLFVKKYLTLVFSNSFNVLYFPINIKNLFLTAYKFLCTSQSHFFHFFCSKY